MPSLAYGQMCTAVRGFGRSFIGYAGLAEADVESPICQIVYFWHNEGLSCLVAGNADITLVAAQSMGFGKFSRGAFVVALECISRSQPGTRAGKS